MRLSELKHETAGPDNRSDRVARVRVLALAAARCCLTGRPRTASPDAVRCRPRLRSLVRSHALIRSGAATLPERSRSFGCRALPLCVICDRRHCFTRSSLRRHCGRDGVGPGSRDRLRAHQQGAQRPVPHPRRRARCDDRRGPLGVQALSASDRSPGASDPAGSAVPRPSHLTADHADDHAARPGQVAEHRQLRRSTVGYGAGAARHGRQDVQGGRLGVCDACRTCVRYLTCHGACAVVVAEQHGAL